MADPSLMPTVQADLQEALLAKDSLIEKLTTQLEQTVDQLDRLRRSGADRVHTSGNAGSSARLDQELIERLESMLSQWEESQPHEILQRIEQTLQDETPPTAQRRQRSGRAQERTPLPAEGARVPEPAKEPEKAPAGDDDDFWAKARARLMGLEAGASTEKSSGGPASPVRESSHSAPSVAVPDPEATPESGSPTAVPDETKVPNLHPGSSIPDKLPKPVSIDATREELLDAVDSRDEYIQYLSAKLRDLEQRTIPQINWEVVNNCPDDLKSCVEGISAQLEQQLKESELAIALERANLARERAKLMKVKESLESQVKRLGNQLAAEGQNSGHEKGAGRTAEEKKADMDRRWGRFFAKKS